MFFQKIVALCFCLIVLSSCGTPQNAGFVPRQNSGYNNTSFHKPQPSAYSKSDLEMVKRIKEAGYDFEYNTLLCLYNNNQGQSRLGLVGYMFLSSGNESIVKQRYDYLNFNATIPDYISYLKREKISNTKEFLKAQSILDNKCLSGFLKEYKSFRNYAQNFLNGSVNSSILTRQKAINVVQSFDSGKFDSAMRAANYAYEYVGIALPNRGYADDPAISQTTTLSADKVAVRHPNHSKEKRAKTISSPTHSNSSPALKKNSGSGNQFKPSELDQLKELMSKGQL